VALIRTDVSEDRIASIFRVYDCEQTQSEVVNSCIGSDSIGTVESLPIQELTTSLWVCSQSYTLKIEAIRSSETSVLIRATRRHLPEDDNHHSHRRGNLKSYFFNVTFRRTCFICARRIGAS
jgi:hypothetical protein